MSIDLENELADFSEMQESNHPNGDQANFRLMLAKTKYIFWRILVFLFMGPVYVIVIREGLAFLIPALGQRVSKVPGLSFFNNYESLYGLDLAFFLAIFICIGVWHFWDVVLERFLLQDHQQDEVEGWHNEKLNGFNHVLAFVLIFSDMGLFYLAVSQLSWGRSGFSIAAFMATAAYVAILLFVSYINIALRFKIRQLEEQQ